MTDKKIPIVQCGTCEKWAVGVDCPGSLDRGRCTEYHSQNHSRTMYYFEMCPTWSPVDPKEATKH